MDITYQEAKGKAHETVTRVIERFWQPRTLLLAMVLVQVFWLAASWLMGAANNVQKIPPLIVASIFVGIVVTYLPARYLPRPGQWKERLWRREKLVLLVTSLLVLAAGGIYATQQRYWPDERLAYNASIVVTDGGISRLLTNYSQIPWLREQHPPLMPILFGTAMRLFGPYPLVPRLLTLIFALAMVPVSYLLGRELYGRQTGFTTTLLLLSFPLFLRLGTAGMTDVPVMFFFCLTLLLIVRLRRAPTYGLALLTGAVLVSGILVKYTMVLIYPVLCAWFIASPLLRRRIRYLAVALSLTGVIVVAWLAVASTVGVLGTQAHMLSGLAMVVFDTGIGPRFLLETFTTRLPVGLGLYNLPIMLLGAWYLLGRRDESDLLVISWAAIVSLLLAITLPDHRYFMLMYPAVALTMARGLESMPAWRPRAVALSLLYCAGALYLFVDWARSAYLFL